MRVGDVAFGRFRIDGVHPRQRSLQTYGATLIAGDDDVLLTTVTRARPDEARSVARMIEPLVPLRLARFSRVIAVGTDGPTAWSAVARPVGTSLRAQLATTRRLDLGPALDVALALLAALDDLHQQGHAHLGLRPEAVFSKSAFTNDLSIGELDLARLGAGTPLVAPTVAPELLDVELGAAGPPADVFAIGALLYELVSGTAPFAGSSASLAASIATDEPEPLSARRGGISPALDRVIERALAKKPADRFATAGELLRAIEATRAPARTTSVRPGDAPSSITPHGGVPIDQRPPDDEVAWSAALTDGGAGKSSHAKVRAREGAPRFSGALASQQLEYARKAHGTVTIDRAIAALPLESREELESVTPAGWVRVDAFERFHVALANELGRSVEQTHPEIARNGGKRTFESLWRLLLRFGGASLIMSRAPVVYAKTYDTGTIESRDIGPTGGSFVLVGWPDVPEFVLRGLRAGMTSALETVGRTSVELTSHRNPDGATFRARWDE